jgi:hypothetical protein
MNEGYGEDMTTLAQAVGVNFLWKRFIMFRDDGEYGYDDVECINPGAMRNGKTSDSSSTPQE